MTTFLERGDVARELNVASTTVRDLADNGVLRVAARTRRGVRLFDPRTVEALKRERAQRRVDESTGPEAA